MKSSTSLCLFFALSILLQSCSAYNPVSTYLKEQKKCQSGRIFVFPEKVSDLRAISILQGTPRLSSSGVKIWAGSKMYSEVEYEELKREHLKDDEIRYWKPEDFKIHMEMLKVNFLSDLKSIPKEILQGDRLFLSFSEPIQYKYKDQVFFFISESTNIGVSTFSGIVVMKKEKGEWKIVEKIASSELH
ncbi:MAG: hypothetical protein EOO50_09295 [Flavobacterium sp.]|uniref:hypothetical protein n=1 Tax=Flavobacterium sp. TaxID=239 RepID=UPI00121E3BE0|nr:hypothetical protein [Flavobacterium sp.]RZJ66557.1 MAG: hypothetical protein EOO50_09295 [Flavobacterium sp.]